MSNDKKQTPPPPKVERPTPIQNIREWKGSVPRMENPPPPPPVKKDN